MFRNAQITVLVPAFNESRHIQATLRAVPAFVDRIVVIDDGSHDDTASRAAATEDARVRIVRHAQNCGVGAALRTGYQHAFEMGTDIAVVMAGDGQMDPADLPALLAPIIAGEADYAKGNRLGHPDVVRRMPFARLLGNRALSFLTRCATGLAIDDSQCGYTALHRRIGERMAWRSLWHGYGYPNDLLGMLQRLDARVRDVVVRPIYADEQSGVRLRHALFVVPYVLLRVLYQRVLAYTKLMRSANPVSALAARIARCNGSSPGAENAARFRLRSARAAVGALVTGATITTRNERDLRSAEEPDRGYQRRLANEGCSGRDAGASLSVGKMATHVASSPLSAAAVSGLDHPLIEGDEPEAQANV